jgi:putative ABC transport system ATP-binding protein
MEEPLIKIDKLDVIYFLGKANQVSALTDINLEIYQGEFIIFFGPSGCGKSTLLYSIAGLERNVQGDIMVNGKNLSKFKNRELEHYHQKTIGMIFQAYYLIHTLTVSNNVQLPQISIGASIKERRKKALDLLEHFGVSTQADKLPAELSGGQQQRVAICRSLINDPDMLLADEPVGNLDSKSSDDVMFLLKELNDKFKKTVILVTHNPTHLNYAHRVFHMKDGKIIKVEVNDAINDKIASEKEQKGTGPDIPKELELLARTYSSISPELLPTLLLPFKAKEIVSEVLTGMIKEDVEKIEKRVEHLLLMCLSKNTANLEFLTEEISNFFDLGAEKGGMDLDKRQAETIAAKVRDIVAEMRLLIEKDKKIKELNSESEKDSEVAQLRHYLLEHCQANLKSLASLERLNQVIRDRLDNKLDRLGTQAALDLSLAKGGAGIDRRTAKKLARMLELLVLGKMQ